MLSPSSCAARLLPVVATVLASLASPLALAQTGAVEMSAEFLNLSFPGDGETPLASDLFAEQERRLSTARAAGSVSDSGDLSFSVPLTFPPARLAPELGLSYSSSGSAHSWVSRGWTLQAGMRIERVTGVEAAHAYATEPNAHRVTGGGLSGLLVQGPSGWRYVSTAGGAAHAELRSDGAWVVRAGGRTTLLEPEQPSGAATAGAPVSWHTRRVRDERGNTVDYVWTGARLDDVRYGGTTSHLDATSTSSPHLFGVGLRYATSDKDGYRSLRGRGGYVDVIDARLLSLDVRTFAGGAVRSRFSLDYKDLDGLKALASVHEVGVGAGVQPTRLLAEFEYAGYPFHVASEALTYDAAGEAPPSLNLNESRTGLPGVPGESSVNALFTDYTGDGLPELLSARRPGLGGWMSWRFQWDDPSAPSHGTWFADEDASSLNDQLERTASARCGEREAVSMAISRLVDLNGDGHLDLVTTTAPEPLTSYYPVPTGYPSEAQYQAPPECGTADIDSPTAWSVRYGAHGGFGIPHPLTAPVQYPRVAYNAVRKPRELSEFHALNFEERVEGAVTDMADVDGDGWADIVRFVPRYAGACTGGPGACEVVERVPVVHYHDGRLNGGWSSTAVSLAIGAQRSMSSSMERLTVDATEVGVWAWEPVTTAGAGTGQYYHERLESSAEVAGFRDVNGDGLTDFVNAAVWTAATPAWKVWLGTGGRAHPFDAPIAWPAPLGVFADTNEGRPLATICTGPKRTSSELDQAQVAPPEGGGGVAIGEAVLGVTMTCSRGGGVLEEQQVTLLDMDGDGRSDLVDAAAGLWWRNLGDRFSRGARPTPDWFGGATSRAGGWQFVVLGAQFDPYTPPTAIGEGAPSVSSLLRRVTTLIVDVNGDGLPDRVDYGDDPWVADAVSTVTYHPRPSAGPDRSARPGLLTAVRTTFGASTTYGYASSATMSPAGRVGAGAHEMAAHRDLVVVSSTREPVTGALAERRYAYEDGVCSGGVCQGFRSTRVEDASFDPEVHAVGSPPQPTARTETRFLLGRDYALPVERLVSTDRLHPVLQDGFGSPVWRVDVGQEYAYKLQFFAVGSGHSVMMPWLRQRRTTEHAEDGVSASRIQTVAFERDAFGNVLAFRHRGAASDASDTDVLYEYTSNADASLFAPSKITTRSWDPASLAWVTDELVSFAYDNGAVGAPLTAGLLTRQLVASGPRQDIESETEEWAFTRTARGAVARVDAPHRGPVYTYWTLGDALPWLERNALGHQTAHKYDALGRRVSSVDANKVEQVQDLDALGRPVASYTRAATPPGPGWSAAPLFLTTRYRYDDTPGAAYVATEQLHYETAPATSTAVVSTPSGHSVAYSVLDGFGDVVQSWAPGGSASEWLLTDVVRDVAGRELRRSYPHSAPLFSPRFSVTRSKRYAGWTDFDAYGRPRRTWEDYEQGVGVVEYFYARPGEARTLDVEDYERVQRTDALGRLTSVEERRLGVGQQTGRYRYDGRGRLTGFLDANHNQYAYTYDGVGRVREVRRAQEGCAPFIGSSWCKLAGVAPWFSYDYAGSDPVAMYEGAPSPANLVSAWDYDALGRATVKQVLNRGTGAFEAYTWSRDAQWRGAVDVATDPSGATEFRYDRGAFGALGRVSSTKRIWKGDNHSVAFETAYDLDGAVLSTRWPDGTRVDATLEPDTRRLLQHEVKAAGGASAEVRYSYDAWGLPSGWVGGELGRQLMGSATYRAGPTRVDRIEWMGAVSGPADRSVRYEWQDNGLLQTKQVNGALPQLYGYDEQQRVSYLVELSSWRPLEVYDYDPLGNLRSMYGRGTQWSYGTPTFSQSPGRASPTGASELHSWDAVGRMQTWNELDKWGKVTAARRYTYDGAGRLIGLQEKSSTGAARAQYGYDGSNALVREQRVDGAQERVVLRFGGYRYDSVSKRAIQKLLPMVSLSGGTFRWTFTEPDGHALETFDSYGRSRSFEVLGAYGVPLAGQTSGSWEVDDFHGVDVDERNRVMHMGARHALQRDGLWMQPEPLLYLGMTNGDLGRPLNYGGVYAAGNPLRLQDRSGNNPVLWVVAEVVGTGLDVAGVGISAWGFVSSPSLATAGSLALDVGLTAAGAALPGAGLSAMRHTDDLHDGYTAAKALMGGEQTVDTLRVADGVGDASKEVDKVVKLPSSKYPESAAHARDAQAAGHPDVLTIDRPGAPGNRGASLKGIDKVPGKQLDEYPPAMFKEGGAGASVRPVTPSDNMGAGACIGNQCRGLPDGATVRIEVE